MACHRRVVQRGAAARRRCRIHVGAAVQQQLDDAEAALKRGVVQGRRGPLRNVCRRVGIDPSAEQRFDSGGVAARCRTAQLLLRRRERRLHVGSGHFCEAMAV